MDFYELEDETIKKRAPEQKGIYFLGNLVKGKFVVGYVGRSDKNLKKRLLTHNHRGKFKFFSFNPVRTKRDGFLLETENWYLGKTATINKIRPSIPRNLMMEHPCDTLGKFMRKKYSEGKKNG